MNSIKNDGGAAFPRMRVWDSDKKEYADCYVDGGMSLRDYFAAKALVAMQAHQANDSPESAAAWSYKVADAMIAERSKSP